MKQIPAHIAAQIPSVLVVACLAVNALPGLRRITANLCRSRRTRRPD